MPEMYDINEKIITLDITFQYCSKKKNIESE